MKTTNNIPQGYKNSPLGIIPQEWEVKKLGDVAESFSGGTPKAGNNEYYDGNIPFIRSGEIHQKNTALFLSELGLAESSAKIVEKGDLLIALYGANSGDSAISQINGAINQAILCIRPYNLLTSFLCSFLELKKNMYVAKYLQGGQGNLSGDIVNNYIIPIPPLPEQQKISEILNVWDEAIKKQTQLIEKLELRKKGLMQQLLTGKKRLPGFSGEWKKIAIKDFAIEISLKNNRNENWEVLSCTKYDGLVPSLQYFGRQVFSKDITQYKIVPQYCFAYATNHIEEGSIGYQSTYRNALISPMYTVFKTDSNVIDDIFLYKLLKSHHAIYLYNVMMEGSIDRRGGLRWDNFSTIKFLLPDIKEQSAIADILVSCDNEILLAKQKLNEFHQQKKGLMQILLTGKKRVTQ